LDSINRRVVGAVHFDHLRCDCYLCILSPLNGPEKRHRIALYALSD
jgi:hypothetical protein